jgi:hypothetical protein
MKPFGLPTFVALLVAAAIYVVRPSPSVLSACLGVCLAVGIVAAFTCAIRERQFSVFGFIRLESEKPVTANLSTKERFAFQYAAAVLTGIVIGASVSILYGVA